jgi:DNA-binding winged helix-turn-helix (wHTH) protein
MDAQAAPVLFPQPTGDSVSAPGSPPRFVRFAAFHLDLRREELFKNGSRVKLQGKAFQVLLTLLEQPGEVVTREALRMRLWPQDTHVNYDANVNTTVNKLRQVLGDNAGQAALIETVPRKGYSFIAKIEFVDQLDRKKSFLFRETPPAQERAEPSGTRASFLLSEHSQLWFTAGVIALVIAGMLFGAAIALFSHRAF